jgi:Tfp pilus assembly protein PilX
MKQSIPIKENGSVLIVALVLLVLLTLMGISATMNTDIELQIAGNELIARANFYRAEAAAMENIQVLDNEGEQIIEVGEYDWLHLEGDLPNTDDITDAANWTNVYSEISATADSKNDQRYLTVFEGVIAGDSLDMTRSRIYTYRIVGSNRNNGLSIIEMGFKKPF